MSLDLTGDSPELVSIIIATHNRLERLKNCLEYIFNQSYPALEVIVVDNGSTDGTAEWIKQSSFNIKLLQRDQNYGVWSARAAAMNAAQARYIISLDDDAELQDQHAVQKALDIIMADETIGVLAFQICDGDTGQVDKRLVPRVDRRIVTHTIEVAHFVAAGAMIRKSAYEQAGGLWEMLDPYFGGDMELGYRILDAGYIILQTPDIQVKHFIETRDRLLMRSLARIRYGTAHVPWMAVRNLPWYCVLSMTTMAWGFFFLDSIRCGRVDLFFKGLKEAVAGFKTAITTRKCIAPSTRVKIKKLKGRYYW